MKVLLEGKNVNKRFGGIVALNKMNFTVEEDSITGLIGPNGSGKTTLFNVITGFYKPDSGKIFLNGKEITRLKAYKIRREGIARTFQIPRPFLNMSVFQNVLAGILWGNTNYPESKAKDIAEETLKLIGLADKRDMYAKDLNVFEKKITEFGRALISKPKVLLLDELIAGLNPREVEDMLQLIIKVQKEFNATIFMVEHVMRAIMSICDTVMVIHHGERIAEGTPKEVQSDQKVIEVYLGREVYI